MKAMFIHNDAYDIILVSRGYALPVSDELKEFIEPEMDFDNWCCSESWKEHGETMQEASEAYGDVLAYIDDNGNLVIVEEKLWQSRLEFYGLSRD